MSSNEKIQVMNNIVECMNEYGYNITLNELKKYQYIDLKNKIFSDYINKVIHDFKKLNNEKLDNGLYDQFDRYPELYVDEKHFKLSDYNFIKVIEYVKEKISKFIVISKNNNNINSKLKIFFKENFNYEIPPENLNTNINFEKIKNDIKEKNLSKLNKIQFFLKNPNKTFINLFKKNIEYSDIYNDLKEFFKNNFKYEIINNLLNINKVDESKIENYLKDISKNIKYNNEMLDDVIDLFFSKIENIKNIKDISKNIKYNNAMLDDIIKLFFIKIENTKIIEDNKKKLDDIKKSFYSKIKKIEKNTEKNREKATEEAINAVEKDINAVEKDIKAKEEDIKAKEKDIQKDIEKDTIDLFFNKINLNDNNLKQNIKYLFNNIAQIDITNFFHLYYYYSSLNKSLNYSPIVLDSGFRESNDIKYYFNTKKKYLIIKSYQNFKSTTISNNSLEKIISYYIYIDINTFLEEKGFYLFFKINKFYEDNIKNIALNKTVRYLQYFNNKKKNKDFYILSFNENAKNYTESDSNNVVGGVVQLNPSVLIICTQESGSGIIKNFQKILQKRLNSLNYKLISHRDESKTVVKLMNRNVRTYFYVNMDKINFGDAIKRKFKTIGKKRLFIFENRNVTEQERNNENKSIELINYEWKRSKESFGYKYANTIGRVLKGTIYKGAICLKITLKYNGLEHSFIIVNTNFSEDDKKKDQFDSVCKEFNLENEINNSTIFFCGDLNFNINRGTNELNKYIKNHIVLYDDVSDKMKNLYKKFLDCINNININKRLPNRIIYAISDKDKYEVDINKDNFGSIQIKEGSNMSSFEFNFMKNNANKLTRLIEAIPNIRTVQNLKRIANITANMNVPENFEDKYREVLKMMSQKANKNILPNLSGLKNIFNIMSGEKLDEFIFLGNDDYGYSNKSNNSNLGSILIYNTILNINNKIVKINNNNNKIKKFENEINKSNIKNKNNILKKIYFLTSRYFLLGFDDFINKCTIKNENYSIRENIETKSDKLFSYLYFNDSLFFSLKEISKIFIKPAKNQSYYNEHLIPPLYSAISIILYDFQNNKFYTFIKPIQDSINFTNFLLNNRNFNIYSHKIEYLKNNIINNYNNKDYKKYYSIKDNNIYLANRYIKKDFYLVSFKDDNNNHNNLIKNISAQICLENPLFVIIFIENSKNFINNMKKELNIYYYEIYEEHKLNNISISIFINSFYKKNSLNKNNSINCQYIDNNNNNNNNFIKLKLQIFIDNEKYNLSFILCKKISENIISSNDTFIIGNLSNENEQFINKYNNDNSIYKTDTFHELKDNTELYKTFKNTEYLNSIDTLRIHPENRIVYNNDNNIYINPYDLNFYDNIETLSFRLVPRPYPENYKEIFNIVLAKIFFIQSIIKEESSAKSIIKYNGVSLSTDNINKRITNYKEEINSIKQIQQNSKLQKFIALIRRIIKLRYTTKITENSKDKIDNFIKEINRFVFDTFVDIEKIMNFFASDIDDVYKFKMGEYLYYYNLLDKESEIRKLKYYPYS